MRRLTSLGTRRRTLRFGFVVAMTVSAAYESRLPRAQAEEAGPASAKKKISGEFSDAYEAAMRLYQKGRYGEALVKFQAAYDIDPQTRLLYNMGRTQFRLGQDEEAVRLYQRFLERERDVPADIRKQVEEDMQQAKQRAAAVAPPPAIRERSQVTPGDTGTPGASMLVQTDVAAPRETVPIYKRWWLWTALGGAVAVAGGVAAGVVLGRQRELPPYVYEPSF